MNTCKADVIELEGSPAERGAAQVRAAGVDAAEVRAVLDARYSAAATVIESEAAHRYLAGQMAFARRHAAPEMSELDGVAAGLGIAPERLFALLHLSILSHAFECDGCTAWARPRPEGGAILVKNRDLSGPHRHFQAVFRHRDPTAPGGVVLNVGTIGAPGVYSSGINGAGLALADTAIPAPRHQIGWLRYLLMTRILFTCRTVSEAIDLIGSLRHAGGGSLILADASGAVASVELLAEGPRIDRSEPAFRTNHFLAEPLRATEARVSAAAFTSTTGRLANLRSRFDSGLGLGTPESIQAAMASHGPAGFCRHGEGDGAHTVSCALYTTADRRLRVARGNPCIAPWENAATDGEGGAADASAGHAS
ncbi:C45 family peptidase [Prosthecomicrobium sp. N25]|uniref:C45 family peptidase n=1 Tax=Prosthecomicrobium sp. N25 TaxID=3129254 RepID=UPI0030771155